MSMESPVRAALLEAQAALQNLLADEAMLVAVEEAGALLAEAFRKGGRVYSCGNGGSMCDAMHFAEELSGRYRKNRAPLAAAVIGDAGHISCVANDFGYDHIFSRYVEAHGRAGDVLLAISTSGQSPNVMKAVEQAQKIGMKVIGMTGHAERPLAKAADVALVTPGGAMPTACRNCTSSLSTS